MNNLVTIIVYTFGLAGLVVAVGQLSAILFEDSVPDKAVSDIGNKPDKIAQDRRHTATKEARDKVSCGTDKAMVSDNKRPDILDDIVREEVSSLEDTDARITEYLAKHPERAKAAKRYTNYYKETAHSYIQKYIELQNTVSDKEEMEKIAIKARTVLKVLNENFRNEYKKLYGSEVFDFGVDGDTIKKVADVSGAA